MYFVSRWILLATVKVLSVSTQLLARVYPMEIVPYSSDFVTIIVLLGRRTD